MDTEHPSTKSEKREEKRRNKRKMRVTGMFARLLQSISFRRAEQLAQEKQIKTARGSNEVHKSRKGKGNTKR
tara:strand:+ start:1684 stop:1899 length:216 start_codon:yes stop_codon:yes gene_type:complete